VGSITAQQVSLFSATAIRNRFIEAYGVRKGEAWQFPTRERTAELAEGDLTALGFSRRKEEYVLGLARSEIDLEALRDLDDDEIRARIVALRGLGEWTAEWFLARHLARPNAWPWGDLALRKAVADLYRGLDVREARERFHPFENLAAHYLLLAQRIP
jgi:DNA-3-methyladenine glycosylase II